MQVNSNAATASRVDSESTTRRAVGALRAVLAQLDELLERLSDAEYGACPVGVFSSPIGSHVRHCLDHVAALGPAAATGLLDYDARQRGTAVENSRAAALAEARRLLANLNALAAAPAAAEIELRLLVTSDGPPVRVRSTLGRELAFVLSHTIHHNAIIGAMAQTLGVRPPERFGYAPSTLAFLEQAACAPSR